MELQTDLSELLDLTVQPGFCARDGVVVARNQSAHRLLLEPGAPVLPMLLTGVEEYQNFSKGCLYLRLTLGGREWSASVLKARDLDVFLLEQDCQVLQSLALAAQTLRGPLGSVMLAANSLGKEAPPELMGQLNRGLNQLLRTVNNMSDALLYSQLSQKEYRDLGAVFEELFQKAQTLLEPTGLTIRYQGPRESVMGLGDVQQLERAVLNILSNAAKFSPPNGQITAKLSRWGKFLRLTIGDSGPGIPEDVLKTVFFRHLRQPGIEDGRYGLGLGMTLVRSVAANHGGTVLLHQSGGAQITMTIALGSPGGGSLRSPVFHVDYAGDRDHALLELSEVLPAECYET